MENYQVSSSDPNIQNNDLKIGPLVTEEMMETQGPTLVQNEVPETQDKMSLIVQAATMVSEEMMDTREVNPTTELVPMLSTHSPNPKCLICDFVLVSASQYDVNYSMMPKSGVYLSNSLNKVLKEYNVTLSKTRSTLLCEICFNLLDELELMDEQTKLIRNTLLNNFTKTCELYNQLVTPETYSAHCQTDLLASDILLHVVKEEKPVERVSKSKKPVQKKQTRSRTTRSKTKAKKKYYGTSDEEDNISNVSVDDNYVPDDDYDETVPEDIPTGEPTFVDMIVKPDPDAEDVPPSPPPVKSKRRGRSQDFATDKRKRNRRVHPCEHCARMFRSHTEVKNHILVKHLDRNPNHCVFCEKKLNSRTGLTSHLRTIHNVVYNEKKELVSNIMDRDAEVEPVDESLLLEQRKILEDAALASDLSDADNADLDGVSNSEAQDSDFPAKKSTRSRSRRKEKENRASSRSRSRSRITKVTVPYLSEEGIGEEEFVLKEEKVEIEEEYQEVKEELIDGKEKKPKAKRKRNRPPRIGERACMPLIHECPTCGKKWRTVSELNAHIQTHSNLRPWVCEICGQGYKMRKALLVHVGMHNGVHPFTCNYCNKSFTQKVGLEKHMFIHSGTKRYQCDLCGKGFIHLKSYQIHKMIHSGERHIKCDICNLALLSKSHLKQHLRVHTGERPHECEVCGKKFAKKSNLNAHKKKVHQLLLPPGRVPQLPEGEIIPPPIHNHPPVPAAPGLLLQAPVEPQVTHIIVPGLSEVQLVKPLPRTLLKCELCEFTSSRKQSLDDHWEREHSRFINNYTGQYEQYAM